MLVSWLSHKSSGSHDIANLTCAILCCFATIMYAWHRVSDWNQDDDSYDMWLNSLMQDSRDSPLNSSFMNICCKPREDNCASLFWKFSNSTRPNITLMKFDIHGLIASSRETSQSAIKTEPRKVSFPSEMYNLPFNAILTNRICYSRT